jgi:hypothetical protein
MDLNKILNNKRNQYIIGGVVLLGVGFYLYKKGKLPFFSKKHKLRKITKQGRVFKKDVPNGRFVEFEIPIPYEELVKTTNPQASGLFDLIDKNNDKLVTYKKADRVILKGTNIDGNYQIAAMGIDGSDENRVLKNIIILSDKEPMITGNKATVEFVKSSKNPDYPLDKLTERQALRK